MLEARKCVREMCEYQSPVCAGKIDLHLDLNENTSGCSPRVLARMRSLDAKTLALYPPREPGEKLVADFLGIDPAEVMLTNGADEGIDLLCRAYLDGDDELIIVTPAFSMYEIFGGAAGARIVRVPAGPEFRFPVTELLRAITPRTRLIVVTNPNNPTGVLVPRQEILQVLEAAPQAAVLVDEAYFDFCGETVMDRIGRIPNLFIARTFSKAYGMAGVRLGVLAGAENQMAVVRRMASPFNVNVFALECLAEALADREFVQGYIAQVCSTREWLRAQMQELGFESWPSLGNFVLVNFGGARDTVLAGMRARGISLRERGDCPGCIRITIGTKAEMERVVSALKELLAERAETRQVAR